MPMMNIEVRHDNHIDGNAKMIDYIRSQLDSEFERYNERVTHLEVHLSDVNNGKGTDQDKHCMIEAHAAGLKPIVVTCKAGNVDQAIDGAIEKMHHALEHQFAKHDGSRHSARPSWEEISVE